jgi:hypothetical protein
MRRRPLLPLTAIAALILSAAAQAQEAPASPPAAAAAPAPAHKSYSPDQMSGFARATVELQNLGSQDPQAMTRAIQGAGMSVEDYNQMGDAMRADPALASNLTPYLDSATNERAARIYAQRSQTPSYGSPTRRTSSHRAVASHKASTHKASGRRSGTHKASHTRASKKSAQVTKASHKASSGRHTARKSTTHASSAAHKARRHKRS